MALLLNSSDQRHLDRVVRSLNAGVPIALPTETVYGLAARVDQPESLARVFKIKQRPHFDPLIVHVRDWAQALVWAEPTTDLERLLAKTFWPGPLTMLLKKKSLVPDLCTAGSALVAMRAPSHDVFQKMIEGCGVPLAAPSANRFGSISPTTARAVIDELGPLGLEAVLDAGPCSSGIESTIVHFESERTLAIHRLGALSLEKLGACLGSKIEIVMSTQSTQTKSPGQLESHYAPLRPLYFCDDESLWSSMSHFARDSQTAQMDLLKMGSDVEAAAVLFATLRELDRQKPAQILALAMGVPNQGLWPAIKDRLRRASQNKGKSL
jgi:L-threonylcarbamoyladenylate synthase